MPLLYLLHSKDRPSLKGSTGLIRVRTPVTEHIWRNTCGETQGTEIPQNHFLVEAGDESGLPLLQYEFIFPKDAFSCE
ncbi:hypothetical protein CBD41_09565 [bacterium TMED181]|nr:hypothetical protein [Planctomycetota bacterium]OUW42211.1 MAG: hypothetical protein CBD41_09565 [bacterium TMED181]